MSRDHSQNHYGPNASFDGYDSDLASAGILIESLRQQVTLLRDELFAVLVQDMSRDSAIAKIEALDATADLDGLILCEKEPAAWKTVEMLYPPITEEQRRSSDVPLYRAWGPKP